MNTQDILDPTERAWQDATDAALIVAGREAAQVYRLARAPRQTKAAARTLHDDTFQTVWAREIRQRGYEPDPDVLPLPPLDVDGTVIR